MVKMRKSWIESSHHTAVLIFPSCFTSVHLFSFCPTIKETFWPISGSSTDAGSECVEPHV